MTWPLSPAAASDLHAIASATERPLSLDVLALAAPAASAELRVRVMTGDEATVIVPVTWDAGGVSVGAGEGGGIAAVGTAVVGARVGAAEGGGIDVTSTAVGFAETAVTTGAVVSVCAST